MSFGGSGVFLEDRVTQEGNLFGVPTLLENRSY